MNRAYSLIEKAAVDDGRRVFSGIATTPEPDRMQDTIDPMGAKFANPLVLLHQHRHDAPIGSVTFGTPTAKGIPFTAEIAVIEEPGPLKDRVDTAWGELKAGLVRAVSIGFRPIKYAYLDDGGIEFQEVEIFELSTVSVPANPGAVINQVKSIDQALRQSLGLADTTIQPPGKPAASGKALPVVKLNGPARVRAKPFLIRKITPEWRCVIDGRNYNIRESPRQSNNRLYLEFLAESGVASRIPQCCRSMGAAAESDTGVPLLHGA